MQRLALVFLWLSGAMAPALLYNDKIIRHDAQWASWFAPQTMTLQPENVKISMILGRFGGETRLGTYHSVRVMFKTIGGAGFLVFGGKYRTILDFLVEEITSETGFATGRLQACKAGNVSYVRNELWQRLTKVRAKLSDPNGRRNTCY